MAERLGGSAAVAAATLGAPQSARRPQGRPTAAESSASARSGRFYYGLLLRLAGAAGGVKQKTSRRKNKFIN